MVASEAKSTQKVAMTGSRKTYMGLSLHVMMKRYHQACLIWGPGNSTTKTRGMLDEDRDDLRVGR